MDEEIFLIDGRPVPELKVVELRKELEQRNLPKSGNKKELVDRLLNYLREERAEQDKQQQTQQNEQQKEQHTVAAVAPDPSITDMVAQYLAQQQIQLEAARRDADKHRASTSSTEDQPADMVQQKEISSPEKMPEKQPIVDDAKDEEEAAPSGSVQQPQVAAEFIPEEPNAIPKTAMQQPSAPPPEERYEEQRIDGDSEAEEPAHRRSASSSDTSTEPGEEPDESKTPAMVQNVMEMEEQISHSDARKVDDQQYEEQATERIEDDDRQMLEETMEETGSGEFVPDEPTGRKEESLQSPTKTQQTIESSTKPATAGGDEELDFEQEVDEDEISNGDDEEDEEERGEADDRGRKHQLQASMPSTISTSPDGQKSTIATAKQLQDSQITTTESADGMEAVGVMDGGRVEVVSNVPTTITAKQSSTEQLSGGFGHSRRSSFVAAGGHRRSSAAAGETVATVEQQAPFEEFTPEGFKRLRPVSPARQDVSRWIHIRGLKRPFTNRGLLELLSKFGRVDTDAFWIDGIKSNCIVTFETAEEAQLAREGLHNVVWPTASDGHLIVEYSSEDKLNRRKAEDQLPPVGAVGKLNGGNGGGMAPAMMPPLPLAPPLMGRGGFGGMEGGMMPSSTQSGGLGLTIVVDNRAPDSFGPQVHIQHDKEQMRDVENRKRKAEELEKSQNTLDQLFKKTKTQPHLYFLPLTSEEVAKRYKNKSAVSSSSNHHKSSSGHRDGREGENRHGHHHSAASSSSATKGRSSGRDEHRGERDRGGDRERRSGRR